MGEPMKRAVQFAAVGLVTACATYTVAMRSTFDTSPQMRAVVHQVCPAGGQPVDNLNLAAVADVVADVIRAEPIWTRATFCIAGMWNCLLYTSPSPRDRG